MKEKNYWKIDMLRGLYTEFLLYIGMDYAKIPDIEVYPLDGTDTATPIREAWFVVKQVDGNGTSQKIS